MRHRLLLAFALLLPTTLMAQSVPSAAPRNGVMSVFDAYAGKYGSFLVAAFDSIPESRYGFRPKPMQQTVGFIAQHLETANYFQCGQFAGIKHPVTAKDSLADTIKARWPKDTLVARLRASLRFCDTAMARLPKLETQAQANMLLALATDLAEHYSQIAGYMRLLDLVPPSALPPRARTAIELPSAVLAQYVGAYQLDENRLVEITMREGVLYLQSTGGRNLRLLAESEQNFFAREIDATLTFARTANGAVNALVVHQYGRDAIAPKVR